jgi:alpha-1,2-rhamnosyltransferase
MYFRVNDPEALAATIADFLSGVRSADPARALNVAWAEASRRIVEVVAREDWLARLP